MDKKTAKLFLKAEGVLKELEDALGTECDRLDAALPEDYDGEAEDVVEDLGYLYRAVKDAREDMEHMFADALTAIATKPKSKKRRK